MYIRIYYPALTAVANWFINPKIPVTANNTIAPTTYTIALFLISAFSPGAADIYFIATTNNIIKATATPIILTIVITVDTILLTDLLAPVVSFHVFSASPINVSFDHYTQLQMQHYS